MKGAQRVERSAPQAPATADTRAGSYVLEWVNRGSRYCRRCTPGGQGAYGPYWYLYLWREGRHLKRYVGKTLPASARNGQGRLYAAPDHLY